MSDLSRLMGLGPGDAALADTSVAHIAMERHRVLSTRLVEGIEARVTPLDDRVELDVHVLDGAQIAKPVHMCFGVLGAEGDQRLRIHLRMGRDSSARFIAHCIFPDGRRVLHEMDADITLDEGATMRYDEVHIHSPLGGVEVRAVARINAGPHSRYTTDFSLLTGRVGRLRLDYTADALDESVVEMSARIFGHGDDRIEIVERISLSGAGARSMIKSRVAVEDDAVAEIRGETVGRAPGARGHVDCTEIIKDRARASAIPVVSVTHPDAKVTHEAAIGSVDRAQLETLCSRGLTPSDATDVIVKGILR